MSVNPDAIQLETYEMVLLRRTRQGRDFDQESRERIFREHLAYTLGLLASGEQVAAGPVTDSPAQDEDICGLGLYQKGSLGAVRQLVENDPGVQQGLYCFDVMTWLTKPGTVAVPQRADTRD
ncbi:MAG: YciI family protein [Streptosporangiaceae bacterium]|jgi:uncharacterized protein YciI